MVLMVWIRHKHRSVVQASDAFMSRRHELLISIRSWWRRHFAFLNIIFSLAKEIQLLVQLLIVEEYCGDYDQELIEGYFKVDLLEVDCLVIQVLCRAVWGDDEACDSCQKQRDKQVVHSPLHEQVIDFPALKYENCSDDTPYEESTTDRINCNYYLSLAILDPIMPIRRDAPIVVVSQSECFTKIIIGGQQRRTHIFHLFCFFRVIINF